MLLSPMHQNMFFTRDPNYRQPWHNRDALLKGMDIHMKHMLQIKRQKERKSQHRPWSALRWGDLPPACIYSLFWLTVSNKKQIFSVLKVSPSTEHNVDRWSLAAISFHHVPSRHYCYLAAETELSWQPVNNQWPWSLLSYGYDFNDKVSPILKLMQGTNHHLFYEMMPHI